MRVEGGDHLLSSPLIPWLNVDTFNTLATLNKIYHIWDPFDKSQPFNVLLIFLVLVIYWKMCCCVVEKCANKLNLIGTSRVLALRALSYPPATYYFLNGHLSLCCKLQGDLKRTKSINVAHIWCLGIFSKKTLIYLFIFTASPPTHVRSHESASGSGQWPGYINHTHTHTVVLFSLLTVSPGCRGMPTKRWSRKLALRPRPSTV